MPSESSDEELPSFQTTNLDRAHSPNDSNLSYTSSSPPRPDLTINDNSLESEPCFNQPATLNKKDRVTFYNDLTNKWNVATITSGPIKYYRKQGRCHNFQTDNGEKGSRYFDPDGLWSVLTDERIQLDEQQDPQQIIIQDPDNIETGFFIDDEYDEQMDLSLDNITPPATLDHDLLFYPSAASFPDLDLTIPQSNLLRNRFSSTSEPDLPSHGCHRSLRQRLERWGSAVRDAWSSSQDLLSQGPSRRPDGGEAEEKGVATPH